MEAEAYDLSKLARDSDIIQLQHDCNTHRYNRAKAQVYFKDDVDQVYSETRKCDVWSLEPDEISFCQEFSNIIQRANAKKWKMNLLNRFESPLQLLYYYEPGHHFDWHHDVMVDNDFNVGFRKITMVYCLSKASDYEGGEFNVTNFDNKIHTVKMNKGDLMILPAAVMHKVSPLISGERTTLVGWYG